MLCEFGYFPAMRASDRPQIIRSVVSSMFVEKANVLHSYFCV